MAVGTNTGKALAVLIPEVTFAPAAALGAVYCAGAFTPGMLKRLEKVVADHIVMPHMAWWEKREGSLRKAHEEYDREKREAMIARGEPVPQISTPVLSPEERAHVIAGILTKGAIAFAADVGATLIGQRIMGKAMLDKPLHSGVAFFEAAIHLGGIAFMSGPGAARGEDMHHWIRHKLEDHGMEHKRADDLGTAIPYIILPGQVGALASLAYTFFPKKSGPHPS